MSPHYKTSHIDMHQNVLHCDMVIKLFLREYKKGVYFSSCHNIAMLSSPPPQFTSIFRVRIRIYIMHINTNSCINKHNHTHRNQQTCIYINSCINKSKYHIHTHKDQSNIHIPNSCINKNNVIHKYEVKLWI